MPATPVALLPGVEHLDHTHSYGGTYITDPDVPWRLVIHKTETGIPATPAAARRIALNHRVPPHLWACRELDWVGQTVLLNRSAFALLHPAGTPETNKMRALQVEVFGRSAESPHHDDDYWHWIGRRIARPLIDAGYPIDLDHTLGTIGNAAYGTKGPVRLTRDDWRRFDGICAHQHVPDNSHWDVGAGRLDLIATGARPHQLPTAPTPSTPQEDDDMIPELIRAIYKMAHGKRYEVAKAQPAAHAWHLAECLNAQQRGDNPLDYLEQYVAQPLRNETGKQIKLPKAA